MRQRYARDERGVTLVELLIAMVVMAVLGAVVTSAVMWGNRTTTSQTRNANLWADIQDASTQLVRDVNDASRISAAGPNELTALVVRDDKCQARAWVADPVAKQLTVTTTFYAQADCSGPSSEKVTRIVGNNAVGTNAAGTNPTLYTAATTFSFFESQSDTALPTPIETDRITRVTWTLLAQADPTYRVQKLTSGAAFTGRGAVAAGTGTVANAKAPLLCLSLRAPVAASCGPIPGAATGKVEGVDHPVLQWAVDAGSATLTQSWTVFRIANPEGTPAGTGTTWTYLMSLPNTATSYTDVSLPAGYTAKYIVRATIPSGVGPSSNEIVTGLRPVAPAVTANGAATSIAVTWTAPTGATGYDVFRDGILAKSVTAGSTLAWTDQPGESGWAGSGYGHTHYYKVVATNRWDNRLTSATDSGRLALGANVATAYGGAARLVSAQAGDYTAPAAPGLAASAGDRVSNLSWTAPAWVGSGPTGQVTSWVVSYRSSTEAAAVITSPAASTTTFTHNGRPAGRYSVYQVHAVNSSGNGTPSAWSGAVWQRPSTPSCTTSGITTRSIVAGANALAATADEGYSNYNVRLGSDPWKGNGTNFDPLNQSTTYTFGVQVSGNGGWSDQGSCTGTTGTLATPGARATPVCSYSWTDSSAPGGYGIVAVTAGVYPGGQTRSGLSAGSYRGSAYSAGYANTDGYNSSPTGPASGTSYCGWLIVNVPPPATPSAGFNFTAQRYCTPSYGFQVTASWTSVPGATNYNVVMAYAQTTGGYPSSTLSTGGNIETFSVQDSASMYGTATIQVQATNASGSSSWSPVLTASNTGGCQML